MTNITNRQRFYIYIGLIDSEGTPVRANHINTQGFSSSLEIGRRYHFNQKKQSGWYIEPQAQITLGHQSGNTFTASNGLRIKVDSYRSVLGRFGTHLGYEIKGGKNPFNIYGKWDWIKEFDGEVGFNLNRSKKD